MHSATFQTANKSEFFKQPEKVLNNNWLELFEII